MMSADSETSEIIRRRLFEWDENAVGSDGRVLLNRDALATCAEFGDWVREHRQQVPEQFPFDSSREAFAATYPFHPCVLSVFERKWQGLPRFQQTRGILRLLALWVGKTASGKYHPFTFERAITALDVEISDEMFIITKETAEAYRKQAVQPSGSPSATESTATVSGERTPSQSSSTPADHATNQANPPVPQQVASGLTWSGEVPAQKWMNFYTKVLTKLGVGNSLNLKVSVTCKPEGGISPQRVEEIKAALRELGLDDRIT
jgi:hypothetical protein